MHPVQGHDLHFRHAIRHAIQSKQFVLHFQPQICLRSGRLMGAEALVRWAHPEKGLLMPDRFIPAAERSTLIIDIGREVIDMACSQIAHWSQKGLAPFPVSANLSARDIEQVDLPDFVARSLAQYRVAPSQLRFEVTESLLSVNPDTAAGILWELSAMGVLIALDDFGTGYSNLVCMQRYPIHMLKLDRAFVRDVASSESARELTRAVVSLGKALGLKVLAEGVETDWQRDFLLHVGCDKAQGFYFSPPLDACGLETFVHGHAPTVRQ